MEPFLFFIINLALAAVLFLVLALTYKKAYFPVTTIVAVLALLGLIIFCMRRRPKYRGQDLMLYDFGVNQKADNNEVLGRKKCGKSEKKEVELPLFSFSSVSAATNNFSATNKLGEGGFGPVYKGVLLKGDEIAVKRFSGNSGQGLEQLKNEASVIAKVQHKNLVRLLGCCIEGDEKILIYEYMPNKSLDFFIFDLMKRRLLNWETRVQIIEGIAQGLLYLHQHSRVRIIHRDLKASNILLDKDMIPKISDFGVAKILFGGNELQAKTRRIVGTYGYMSPEYAFSGIFSIKSDVFSFGVLMLEILSGQKNSRFYKTNFVNLLGYVWELWTSNKVIELIDPVLEDASSKHMMLIRYVNIALLCVQEVAEDRPTMSDVLVMLTNEDAELLPPKKPAFSNSRSMMDPMSPTGQSENCSINGVTISLVQAR